MTQRTRVALCRKGSEYEETVDEHFACELDSSQGSGVSHDESELSDLRCVDEEHEDAPGHVGWPLLGLRGVVRLPPCGSSGTQAGIIPQSMPHFPHVSPLQIRLCQTPQPELVPLRRNHIRATLLPETSAPMVRRYGTLRCFSATHNVCPVLTQSNFRELPNQLYFDSQWQAQCGRLDSGARLCVGVRFAEWLMGLPSGWTSAQPLGSGVLAAHPVKQWPRRQPRHRTISVFSGAGCLDFALSPWCQTLVYIEIDQSAVTVLRARMVDGSLGSGPILGDVRTVSSADLPAGVCGIVAGFPCVDICQAGRRQGLDGESSRLLLEIFRLCDITTCSFVFFENVNNLRFMPQVWFTAFQELVRRGFAIRWVTLAASQIGSPQKRLRWFMYGVRGSFKYISFADPLTQELLPVDLTVEAFNPPGRPPLLEWLTSVPYRACRAHLRMRGNAVIPLQAFTAARMLTSAM